MSQSTSETWETTTAGGVWIITVDKHGTEKAKRIKGKPGFRFKVTELDREASGARFYESAQDPFLNGTFRRIDVPVEEVVAQIPDYDAEQALSDEELLALLESSGMAFHSKVKKLNERNTRRLWDLAEANPDKVSNAQASFLGEYIAETYQVKTVGPDIPQA